MEVRAFCDNCEIHYWFTEVTKIDWITINKDGVTVHMVSKCPDCGSEYGTTLIKRKIENE